jgi:hypothetical protein
MSRLIGLAVIGLACALSACGSAAKRNDARHQEWVAITQQENAAAREAAAQREQQRQAEFTAMLKACGEARCVESLSRDRALERIVQELAGGGAGKAAPLPAPHYERDLAAKAKDILQGATPMVLGLGNTWGVVRQSDNAVRMRESDNEAQRALYDGAFGLGTAAVENAGDRINVGNDYVSGTQHVGDDIAGDGNATHGSQVGDDIADSVVGDGNRFDSDGPFDDSGNCTAGDGAEGGNGGSGTGSTGAQGGAGGNCGG